MSTISVIPFGGVREHGRNLYAVTVNDEIYLLDCGVKVPETEMLGIDVVIPDFTYLLEHQDQIAGVFLTHGHVDAIGALPYLVEKIQVPVFGSELTIALAREYVHDYAPSKDFDDFHVVTEGTEIDFASAVIGFFKTTHSIPDSLGVTIKTDEGQIVYTGDFKFDQSADALYQTDYARLAQIGSEGVLLLLSDSTGADNPMPIASEKQIAEEMTETFRYWEGRIITACITGNLQRVQQIINASYASYRRIFVTNPAISKILKIAIDLGKLTLPSDDIFMTAKEMKQLPEDEVVILESGRIGEPIRAIQRMAKKHHCGISIHDGDLVYLATTPSLSLELFVAQTENQVYRAGGTVKTVSDNFRASGHGDPDDLKLLMNLMKPKSVMPVQGEYRELSAHADIVAEMGLSRKHIYITRCGERLVYNNEEGIFQPAGMVEAENIMIDGLGVGDIGNIVLRDRKVLSEDGIFVAVVAIDRKTKRIISQPQITSRGFVYVKASRNLIQESSEIVKTVVEKHLQEDEFEWSRLKQEIRDQLGRYLFEQTKRRPVILPVIMEATQSRKKAKLPKTKAKGKKANKTVKRRPKTTNKNNQAKSETKKQTGPKTDKKRRPTRSKKKKTVRKKPNE